MIGVIDKLRYSWHYLIYRHVNRKFVKAHPNVVIPPAYFVYETYRLNYNEYYYDGKETAREIISAVLEYNSAEKGCWLDWGCGPARITRHFSGLLPAATVFGSDYNARYVNWCQKNIKGVNFTKNTLLPPFQFANNFFDCVIGISIFTHLPLNSHLQWFDELYRVLKKDGVLYITLQGEAFRHKLLSSERMAFDIGNTVERKVPNYGHRLFSSFHPHKAIYKIIEGKFSVLKIIEGNEPGIQDTWILKKTV